jgi:hypothetical protein
MGPFNWMLISPDPNKPELINAGAGSVRQMHEYLKDDQVRQTHQYLKDV